MHASAVANRFVYGSKNHVPYRGFDERWNDGCHAAPFVVSAKLMAALRVKTR